MRELSALEIDEDGYILTVLDTWPENRIHLSEYRNHDTWKEFPAGPDDFWDEMGRPAWKMVDGVPAHMPRPGRPFIHEYSVESQLDILAAAVEARIDQKPPTDPAFVALKAMQVRKREIQAEVDALAEGAADG